MAELEFEPPPVYLRPVLCLCALNAERQTWWLGVLTCHSLVALGRFSDHPIGIRTGQGVGCVVTFLFPK